MALIKISGKVSNFQQETEVTGAQTSRTGATSYHSQKVINFRVDNKPVELKLKKGVDLAEGDDATVVGKDKGGVLHGIAVRNDGTGVTYSHSTLALLAFGIILTLLGFAGLAVIIGILILPFGLYLLYKAWQNKQALDMLSAPG